MASGSVVPVPFPEYDLALFSLLARLPYSQAMYLWQALLWASVGITIFAVQRLTGMHPAVVAAALFFSDGFLSSFLGQLVPFSVAGLALAAWCASQRRRTLAAISLTLAMCEPHIGFGALLALALLVPASRFGIALCLGILAVLTYAATKGAWTIEYFHDVLGRHIFSEVASNWQYSLTMLCKMAGIPEHIAVFLGEASSLISLALGIVIAGRLYKTSRDEALVVTIPVAFALIGGPFIHLAQIAAALPAALLLHARFPLLRRPLGYAILLLAIPWTAFIELQTVLPFFVLALGLLAWTFIENRRVALGAVIGSVLVLVAAASTFHFDIPNMRIVVSPTAFSEDAWRITVDALFSQHVAFFLPLKIPTWCGLFIVAWAAIKASAKPATAL